MRDSQCASASVRERTCLAPSPGSDTVRSGREACISEGGVGMGGVRVYGGW